MNWIKSIFKWLGAGSPKKPNVTGVHNGRYWNDAEKAIHAGLKISNIRWAKSEWLYEKDGQIMHHSKYGDTPYEVTDWVRYFSGNTWCMVQ